MIDDLRFAANEYIHARVKDHSGFRRIGDSEVFQLFGEKPYDLVRTYQKKLEKGERFRLQKWAVVVGFSKAEAILPPRKPWTNNQGELLYNGIRLPKRWPPDDIVPYDMNPMPVPYLDDRPDVVPIDVGRQLFVDDFLIEKTDLTQSPTRASCLAFSRFISARRTTSAPSGACRRSRS